MQPLSPTEQYDAEHGPESVLIGHWVYFADGYCREHSSYGACVQRFANEIDRLKNVVAFHKAKLAWETKRFDELKSRLTHPRISPQPEQVSELQRLRDSIHQRTGQIEDAQQAVEHEKNRPSRESWSRQIERCRPLLDDTLKHLADIERTMTQEDCPTEVVEDQEVLRSKAMQLEGDLRCACINLHKAGGNVPAELFHYVEEHENRRQTYRSDRIRMEVTNIEI